MNKSKLAKWKHYHDKQKSLWDWISLHSRVLHEVEDCEPKYVIDSITGFNECPKYVRTVVQLFDKSSEDELIKRISELDLMHKDIVGKDKKSAENLPRLLCQVDTITISTETAHQSFMLQRTKSEDDKPNYLWVGSFRMNAEGTEKYLEVIQSIESNQFDYRIEDNPHGRDVFVSHDSILNFAKSDVLQARRFTGTQYRVRIRYSGESKSIRQKYGFLVLSSDSKSNVFESIPEAERPHKLDKIAKKVQLPFKTDWQIYAK